MTGPKYREKVLPEQLPSSCFLLINHLCVVCGLSLPSQNEVIPLSLGTSLIPTAFAFHKVRKALQMPKSDRIPVAYKELLWVTSSGESCCRRTGVEVSVY